MYTYCPFCKRTGGALLGILGLLTHFRCVFCGGEYHESIETMEADDSGLYPGSGFDYSSPFNDPKLFGEGDNYA